MVRVYVPNRSKRVSGFRLSEVVAPPQQRPTCEGSFPPLQAPIGRVQAVSHGNAPRLTSRSPRSASAAGQYRKATLLERYGPDANMVALRLTLAAGCPKIAANRIMDLCGVYYPDRIGPMRERVQREA